MVGSVILDTDAWALAFATCVTLVSVALAGLSAAQVTRWARQTSSASSNAVSQDLLSFYQIRSRIKNAPETQQDQNSAVQTNHNLGNRSTASNLRYMCNE